jgi:hypothetical protein
VAGRHRSVDVRLGVTAAAITVVVAGVIIGVLCSIGAYLLLSS